MGMHRLETFPPDAKHHSTKEKKFKRQKEQKIDKIFMRIYVLISHISRRYRGK